MSTTTTHPTEAITHAMLDRLKPKDISADAVELRLNLLGWPAEADPKQFQVSNFRSAVDEASSAFVGFTATQKRNRLNTNLTPLGAFAADVEWAEKYLGDVRKKRDTLRVDRERMKTNFLQRLTSKLSEPPEDPHTIAMHREIRETLVKLPAEARKLKVQEWTLGGDNEAIRAVLTVPAYLTGLKPDDLVDYREMVAERQDPERFASYRATMAAAEFAERALDGVVRFVEQETRADARQFAAATQEQKRKTQERLEAEMRSRGEYVPAPVLPADHQPSLPG